MANLSFTSIYLLYIDFPFGVATHTELEQSLNFTTQEKKEQVGFYLLVFLFSLLSLEQWTNKKGW